MNPVEKRNIKLAIVDDHNLFRKGLIKLINLGDKDSKYTILFEAENGSDLQAKLNIRSLPDIILMDIDMPGMDGYETINWLKNHYPKLRILVVSMFASEEAILRMIKLKVDGYLSKDIEVEDMHAALEDIVNKGFYYSDMVTGVMANALEDKYSYGKTAIDVVRNPLWDNLNEREREFLRLSCTGLTYLEIADRMNVSPKTIDSYREALFKRFNVKNRTTLALFAVKHSLVTL